MKRTKHFRIYSVSSIIIMVIFISVFGCKKEYPDIEETIEIPTIEILPVTEITAYSAKSGGNVINDGGAAIKARGIIWSTSENPTIENNDGKTTDGKGTGIFHSTLVNLLSETNYYIKAYCINSKGVSYSDCLEFTTIEKKYAGGNGTENDPYLIKTPEQLDSIRYNLDKHFKQIADIDLSNFSREEWIPAGYWIPIGVKNNPFTGSYNGNDFKIINLTVDLIETENVGLFGFSSSSFLQNMTLEKININGKNNVGGLVGNNSGEVINCNTNGIVTGVSNLGGLIGHHNSGEISNCFTNINITGGSKSYFVGGLIGFNEQGIILNSNTLGDVSGNADVGGLIGLNKGQINNSYATSDIIGNWNVGGLVGGNSGVINNCKAEGNVIGKTIGITCVGGLVGINTTGEITNCNAEGDVTGNQYIGGLVGKNMNSITSNYATGKVTGANTVGGLVGWNKEGNITMCYAIGDVFSTGEYINGELDCTGGLVGRHTGNILHSSLEGNGDIFESYATGDVNGYNNTGGLVGWNDEGYIKNNYAHGKIVGIANIGGLIGKNNGQIINSYSIGFVKGIEDLVGGLVGSEGSHGRIKVNYCYYDTNTSGQNDTGKGTPKTTSDMMQRYTYYPHWDFENVWNIDEGKSYPYLIWQK